MSCFFSFHLGEAFAGMNLCDTVLEFIYFTIEIDTFIWYYYHSFLLYEKGKTVERR